MDLEANVNAVRQRIEAACARAGRQPDSVTLVAVTKGQSPEAVCAAYVKMMDFMNKTLGP